ncbi:MAG TPA: tetratricopeptide repeat protein [Chromatiaceae bacterium]|nr:tetratricopeptide repeat protein [Chromatiaceae bacterium]
MMVIPRKNTVTLTYGRSFWEIAGLIISAGGLIFLLAAATGRRFFSTGQIPAHSRIKNLWGRIWEAIDRLAFKIRPFTFVVILVVAACLIVSGAILRNRPVRIYIAGYKAYKQGSVFRKQGKNEQAETTFANAIQIMKQLLYERFRYDHRDVINSLLITAGCYENLKDYKKAETWYRILLEEYPYSRYVAEGYVKLARIYSRRMRKLWRAGANQLKQGFDLKGHGMRMEALDLMEKSLGYYQQALIKDPYSVWADYARKDLEREKNTLEKVKSELFSSPNDPGIRRRVELLMMRVEKIL